jgi:anti-sigma factor RsiW
MTVCSGTLEHVELALLEGSELSSAVQAHLSSCSVCSAEATALRAIVSALHASPAPVAPAGLTARIVPLVLAEAQKGRRQGVFTRVMRPVAAFATAFGLVIASLAAAGGALVVSAALTAGNRTPAPATQTPATVAPATQAPATSTPATSTPATPAPATEAPAESAAPEATPTPEPTDVPRRTPDPVSPDPSEGESTAPTESTSP